MYAKIGSKWIIAFWSVVGLGLATEYNACSQKVGFSQSLSSLTNQMLSSSVVLINGDAKYTNDQQVEVDLQNDYANQVYVTDDPTCNSGGVWEPMQAHRTWTLSESNKEVFVYARYRTTNEGISTDCVSDSIIHDNEKPLVVFSEPNLITNVNVPIFNFIASDSVSGIKGTTCQWPGASAADCSGSSSNGNVIEGKYNVVVVASDNAGNVADPVYQYITVDRTPPVLDAVGPVGTIGNPAVEIDFSGTDNLTAVRFECAKENMTAFASCVSPVNWTAAEGLHHFYVRAVDGAGNVSPVASFDFTVDLTAPAISLSGPNGYINTAVATFKFDGTDNGAALSHFQCSVDKGSYSDCTSPKSTNSLAEGPHTFAVIGIDNAGNKSSPVSLGFTVDLTGPATTILPPTPPVWTNLTSMSFVYSITDGGSGVDHAVCSIDAAVLPCTVTNFSTTTALAAGKHTFKVQGVDKVGNIGASVSSTWGVDVTQPTLVVDSFPALTNQNTATITFKASESAAESGVKGVNCSLNAAAYAPCSSLTSNAVSKLVEGKNSLRIQAVDVAGNLSLEKTVNWTVDLTPPTISFFQSPTEIISNGSSQTIGVSSEDALSGPPTISCALNSATSPCILGKVMTIPNMAAGHYDFVVTSRDLAGNVRTATAFWDVKVPVKQTQDLLVQSRTKVDIIVIVDNSPSMKTEMKAMGLYFSKFLAQLNGLDWQVGIITTDPTNDPADQIAQDGRLLELVGLPGQYILNSSMTATTANTIFQNTVQMKADGSGHERGIITAKRAVQRAFDVGNLTSAPNAALLRPDAVLAFVVVTDAWDDVAQPSTLINEVKAHWDGSKVFAFHSIVVPSSEFTDPNATAVDPKDPCLGFRESVKYDGRKYYALSDLTGGIKADECSTDYGSQLTDIGKITRQSATAAVLKCQPVDMNGDGVVNASDIQVTTQSGAAFVDFVLSGNKLTFPGTPLPAGTNKATFYCYQ